MKKVTLQSSSNFFRGNYVQVCQANLQLEKPITEAAGAKKTHTHTITHPQGVRVFEFSEEKRVACKSSTVRNEKC